MREEIHYQENIGVATCTLTDERKKKTYVGKAFCHPEDRDMMSEKTGCYIASQRAYQHYLKQCIQETKCRLEGLDQLYYSMKHSPHFNPESYEGRMLYRQRKIRQKELQCLKEELQTSRTALTDYINAKDEIYHKVRANRLKNEEVETK